MDNKINLLKLAQTITPSNSLDDLEKTYRRLWKLLNEKREMTKASPKAR